MTRVAIITTTINVPENLELYVEHTSSEYQLDLVVAGDVQTPASARTYVEDLGGVYLGVDDERSRRWDTAAVVGVRSIQRRNLALLHALTLGPDLVITIDDDNAPLEPDGYVHEFAYGFSGPIEHLTSSSTGWYNPGHVLDPPVTHRGFPLTQRRNRGAYATFNPSMKVSMAGGVVLGRVGVVAGLWFGDPDVDAIERIVNAPDVRGFRVGGGPAATRHGVVLDLETWAPFNTQNTAYAWEVAPLMQCLVGVGRYDDIWMSYLAQQVMHEAGWHVRYGRPIAVQVRNEHDLLRDMSAEMMGYFRTDDLITALRAVNSTDGDRDLLERLDEVYDEVKYIFPPHTRRGNDAWIADARVAVAEGTKAREERVK